MGFKHDKVCQKKVVLKKFISKTIYFQHSHSRKKFKPI